MYLQGLLPLDLGSVPKPLKGGSKKGKSKASKRRVDKEDTTWTQLSLFNQPHLETAEKQSYMQEFQVALKKLTLNNKFSFSCLVTPTQKSLEISEVDSTSAEKVFTPYWTEFSTVLANILSLPTKTGFAALGSILSHGCAISSKLKYWFSTKRTSVQNKKWLKMFLPSSMCSVADCTDSESTSAKLLKTVSYQVYPVKELKLLWKKWLAASRKVYNISIEYLNKNQGYTKVGKKGGKLGFRTWLKQSDLIPQWCKDLNISKLLDNASMEAHSAWKATNRESKFIGKGKKKKPNPNAGKKIAKFRSIRAQKQTLQFDPTAYKNGTWMVSTTKHLPKPTFKGQNFCVLTDGATELTYNKGRWFAHFPVEFEVDASETKKVVALDPGVRTFMTGFDGNEFLEFGNNDFQKIAKLCSHLDKLKSQHDKSKGHAFKHKRYKLRKAMERLRTRIKNLRTELHKQVASYLAKNYDVIVLPTFETSQMVPRKKRKLKNKTARAMMTWAFYQFSQILEHLCNRYGSLIVRITEEYTSKTCTKCGRIHRKLGSSKNFKCPHCGYEIPRDFNGAVGIFLKAMWDNTFLQEMGDVVLSFSDSEDILDIQDVRICPG